MDMELGKLFVGGISWDTNENRLREYFQCFGEVVEAMIMKDRATGRARGFGFIVFADPAVAERVVREKHVIDGRTVEAKKAVPRDDPNTLTRNNSSMHGSPGLVRTKKIFVGGLASTVTESDFKKCFEQFGTITDVVVMYDHNTQRPRGFGFITYDSEDAVDRVLYKTFHELNGKMVEVKRAVPKELSPGPSRGQLSGFSYGLSRINSLLNGYSQGYNPTSIGGYGRLSPVTIGRSGFSSFSPGYGTGLNFEPGLSPSYGINANLNSYLGHGQGQGLNTSFVGNSNRYSGTTAYGGTSGVNSSLLNSANHNLWGNGSHNFATNSANSRSFMGSGNGNMGMGSFCNVGALWSSSPPGQDGRAGSTFTSGNLNYGSRDFSCTSPRYGRNSGSNVKLMSSYIANGGHDGASADIFEGGSLYGDSTWRSSPSELDGSGSYGYGLGNAASNVFSKNAASDVFSKNSAGYIGGYGISSRQPTRGIAA